MDHSTLPCSAAMLSDAELRHRVVLLAGQERAATVELIGHLAELELARRFPVVLDLLGEGALNLSTVRLLAPHLRSDNFESLVAEARGRSKRDVEKLVARLDPSPDVAASVHKLPVHQSNLPSCPTIGSPAASCVPSASAADSPAVSSTPIERAVPEAAKHRPAIAPLAPERYRVQFTVCAATHEKLRRTQELLRREIPDGDPGVIFDRALTLLLDDIARKKLAIVSKPRAAGRAQSGSRHIPARVKRAVWVRDGGQCAFRGATGRRCAERAFLEFHHREPFALGGEATEANISLRCRAHNLYEAELAFGSGTVQPPQLAPGRVEATALAPSRTRSDSHRGRPHWRSSSP